MVKFWKTSRHLEDIETSKHLGNFGQLARLRLESSMRYYLKCAYSRRSTVQHVMSTHSTNIIMLHGAIMFQCLYKKTQYTISCLELRNDNSTYLSPQMTDDFFCLKQFQLCLEMFLFEKVTLLLQILNLVL